MSELITLPSPEIHDARDIVDTKAPLSVARSIVTRRFTKDEMPAIHRWRGDFLVWREGAFVALEDAAVRTKIYEFLEAAVNDAGDDIKPTSRMVSDVLDALKAATHLSDATEPPSWLVHYPDASEAANLLPLANGMLDLESGVLFDLTPSFFTLGALPIVFDPDAPEPTNWLKFLAELWPDDEEARGALQELFGYLLVNDTSQEKIFLIVGPKRGGKGTIARVANGLLGKNNVAAPTLASLTTNFGLAPLIGRRLAIISDARLSGRSDQAAIAERLLSISGEDFLTIDRKHREAWTGHLDSRFVIMTNELPKLGDNSGALASRFIILTLQRSFYGHEDTELTARLLTELPGILNWSLEGLASLKDRGHFVQPSSSADMLRDLEDLGSPVAAFVRDRCQVVPGAEVETHRLFRVWREWCDLQGRTKPGTSQSLGAGLKSAIPGITTKQRGPADDRYRVYVGIELQQ